jgi:hypothetical protein
MEYRESAFFITRILWPPAAIIVGLAAACTGYKRNPDRDYDREGIDSDLDW